MPQKRSSKIFLKLDEICYEISLSLKSLHIFKCYNLYIYRAPSAPPKRRPDLLSTADNPEGNLHVVDEVVIGNTVIDDPGSMKVGKTEIYLFTSQQLFLESENHSFKLINIVFEVTICFPM